MQLVGLLVLAASGAALDLAALCPAYPLCDNALLAAYAALEAPQAAPAGGPQPNGEPCANFPLCDVHHVALAQQAAGRKKRELPVPGTTGLVPGSAAEAQWYQQQLAQIALIAGRKKRELPVPGTIPGLVSGSAAEAQWYQQQLAQIALLASRTKREVPTPGTVPGLVSGSAAEAQWYAALLTHQGQLAHHT